MSSGLLCTWAEAAAGCCSCCSLGKGGEEGPCRRATWAWGDPGCCSGFCSACTGTWLWAELLLEASGQPEAYPTPGIDGGVAGMEALSFSSSWSPVWDSDVCSAWQAREPLYFATKNMKVLGDRSLQSKYLSPKASLVPAFARIAMRFPLLPHCSSRLVSPGPSMSPS